MSKVKKASARDVEIAEKRLTSQGAIPDSIPYQQYADADAIDEEIWQSMLTEAGRRAIGAQMAVPIRTQLDYQGVCRKFFEIDELKPGEIARYDKDVDAVAVTVAKRGDSIEYIWEGEYVEPATWEIFAPWSVRLSELNKRRFDVLNRGQEKMRIKLQEEEDEQFLTLAAATVAANTANNPLQTSTNGVTKDFLNKIASQVQKWDLPAAYFLMHFTAFKDIRGWTNTDLDQVTMRELLETGIYGNIWGIDIIVSRKVPTNTVYCITEPRFFGVMPIRTDVMVMPDDKPRSAQIGYVAYEEIGMSIINSNGIAYGTFTYS